MLSLALTEAQRSDPNLTAIKKTTIEGPVAPDLPPYNQLVRALRDEKVREMLAKSHNTRDSEAPERFPEEMFERYNAAMTWLTLHALYRNEKTLLGKDDLATLRQWGIHPPAWDTLDQVELDGTSAGLLWQRLADAIRLASERLWRDEFIGFATEAQAKQFFRPETRRAHVARSSSARAYLNRMEVLTRWAQQLLLLRVEVRLYRIRASKNFKPFQLQEFSRNRKTDIGSQVSDEIKDYLTLLDRFRQELKPLLQRRLFQEDYGDSERMKTLGSLFGPDKTSVEEVGWLRYAEEVKDVLIMRCFDLRLKLYRKNWRVINYSWNLLLKITTVYGTSPGRFAAILFGTIVGFSGLFFLNDLWNNGITLSGGPCIASTLRGLSRWDIVVHYLYLAVTNLTSLGSNSSLAPYCGGTGANILLSFSTLTGYFLLATLAALIMQKLTESER